MLSFDVLIVGGGPSGSSLGYLLQKAGLKSCIVDKATFPRKKLCGGLLTKKTYDLISEIFDDTLFPCERITNRVSLFLGTQKLSSVHTDSSFYLVDRTDFDYYFLKKYLDCEGTVFEERTIKCLDIGANSALLSSGEKIEYKVLIGADGANSQVRKHIDSNYRPNAMCLEFDSYAREVNDEIKVFFSAIRSGYGWCFPKKDRYTVGIGGVIKENKNIKRAFKEFCQNIGIIDKDKNTSGALIPFGKFVKSPGIKNILLIGDAAGFVDPITGEGLYFAFLSAKYASEAIVSFFSENDLCQLYLSSVKHIQKIITGANRFNLLFFNESAKPFFLKMVKGKTHIVKYFCENLLSEYNMTYMGFVTKYLKARHERKKAERHV